MPDIVVSELDWRQDRRPDATSTEENTEREASPATLATFATVPVLDTQSVANVARGISDLNVLGARFFLNTETEVGPATVATVATVRSLEPFNVANVSERINASDATRDVADHTNERTAIAKCDGVCALFDPNRLDFAVTIHSAGCSRPNAREIWVVMVDDVEICRDSAPFYAAARALIAAGANPGAMLRMRHRGSNTQSMSGKVGAMAKWTVSDPDNGGGPKVVRYRPRLEGHFPVCGEHQDGQVEHPG
jgi:hypothetical protein